MLKSFQKIATSVPSNALLFPGHEYALVNALFASDLDPSNPALRELLDKARACQKNHSPCLGFTLGDELLYNPFFRCKLSPFHELITRGTAASEQEHATAVLAHLRSLKVCAGGHLILCPLRLSWMAPALSHGV